MAGLKKITEAVLRHSRQCKTDHLRCADFENHTTDWGEKRQREWKFTVEAKGISPLQPAPPKADPQADLFEGMIAS